MSERQPSGLIVFEGPDDVGKTTLACAVSKRLRRSGEAVEEYSLPGREGGTLGHLVYDVHHRPADFGLIHVPVPAATQIMHVASHADALQRRILPCVEAGRWMILDRCWWSTVAYGETYGVDAGVVHHLEALSKHLWTKATPRLLVLPRRSHPDDDTADRQKLLSAYERLRRQEAGRYAILQVENDREPMTVAEEIIAALRGS